MQRCVPRQDALNCSGGGSSELGSELGRSSGSELGSELGIAEFAEAQDNFDTFGSTVQALRGV